MRGSASRPSPPGAAAGTSPPAGPRTTRWSGSSTGRTATSLSTTPAATPTCCARCCRGRRRPRRGPETSAPSCHRIEDEAAGNVLFALLKRAHLLHRERAAFMEARGVPGGDLQLGSEVEERQLSRQGLVLGESGADHIKAAAFGTGVGQEAIAAENDAKAPDRALHRCRQRLGELCHRNQSVFVHTISDRTITPPAC